MSLLPIYTALLHRCMALLENSRQRYVRAGVSLLPIFNALLYKCWALLHKHKAIFWKYRAHLMRYGELSSSVKLPRMCARRRVFFSVTQGSFSLVCGFLAEI